MDIKKSLLSAFSNESNLNNIRLKYSKIFFVISALVVFSSYFFLILWFYGEIFIYIFKYSYLSFVTSLFMMLIFFYIEYINKEKNLFFFIFLLFIFLFYIASIIFFFIPKNIINNLF